MYLEKWRFTLTFLLPWALVNFFTIPSSAGSMHCWLSLGLPRLSPSLHGASLWTPVSVNSFCATGCTSYCVVLLPIITLPPRPGVDQTLLKYMWVWPGSFGCEGQPWPNWWKFNIGLRIRSQFLYVLHTWTHLLFTTAPWVSNLIYRWGSWGSDRLSSLPKITQLVGSKSQDCLGSGVWDFATALYFLSTNKQ